MCDMDTNCKCIELATSQLLLHIEYVVVEIATSCQCKNERVLDLADSPISSIEDAVIDRRYAFSELDGCGMHPQLTVECRTGAFLGLVICSSRPITVNTVKCGGFAQQARLLVGEEILTINGRQPRGASVAAVAALLRRAVSAADVTMSVTVARKVMDDAKTRID
jgi:hypothetical protein